MNFDIIKTGVFVDIFQQNLHSMSVRYQCIAIKSFLIISIIDFRIVCVTPTVAFLLRFGVLSSEINAYLK